MSSSFPEFTPSAYASTVAQAFQSASGYMEREHKEHTASAVASVAMPALTSQSESVQFSAQAPASLLTPVPYMPVSVGVMQSPSAAVNPYADYNPYVDCESQQYAPGSPMTHAYMDEASMAEYNYHLMSQYGYQDAGSASASMPGYEAAPEEDEKSAMEALTFQGIDCSDLANLHKEIQAQAYKERIDGIYREWEDTGKAVSTMLEGWFKYVSLQTAQRQQGPKEKDLSLTYGKAQAFGDACIAFRIQQHLKKVNTQMKAKEAEKAAQEAARRAQELERKAQNAERISQASDPHLAKIGERLRAQTAGSIAIAAIQGQSKRSSTIAPSTPGSAEEWTAPASPIAGLRPESDPVMPSSPALQASHFQADMSMQQTRFYNMQQAHMAHANPHGTIGQHATSEAYSQYSGHAPMHPQPMSYYQYPPMQITASDQSYYSGAYNMHAPAMAGMQYPTAPMPQYPVAPQFSPEHAAQAYLAAQAQAQAQAEAQAQAQAAYAQAQAYAAAQAQAAAQAFAQAQAFLSELSARVGQARATAAQAAAEEVQARQAAATAAELAEQAGKEQEEQANAAAYQAQQVASVATARTAAWKAEVASLETQYAQMYAQLAAQQSSTPTAVPGLPEAVAQQAQPHAVQAVEEGDDFVLNAPPAQAQAQVLEAAPAPAPAPLPMTRSLTA